jgi:hypothetical protein
MSSLEVPGCHLMVPSGPYRSSLEVLGGPWRSLEVPGGPWVPWRSLEVPGGPWTSLEIPGLSLEVHIGPPWRSLEIQYRSSMDVPGGPWRFLDGTLEVT